MTITQALLVRVIRERREAIEERDRLRAAAQAVVDEVAVLLDPENAVAAHGKWHPAHRPMGEESVEPVDDDGCSLWVEPWEVAALVNGAVALRAALEPKR